MSGLIQRRTALQFCVATLGWLAALFGWACLLSFDIADPPSRQVWPPNAPVHNWCGPVGAWLAYHLFHYLGVGVYALWALYTVGLWCWTKGARFTDAWLRIIGVALILAACSAGGAIFLTNADHAALTGSGGALGRVVSHYLIARLELLGTLFVLGAAALIGLILAADQIVAQLFRGMVWAGRHSAPILVRGGSAIGQAGAALATGVAEVSGRLATAAAGTLQPAPATSAAGSALPRPARRVASPRSAAPAADASNAHDASAPPAPPVLDAPAALAPPAPLEPPAPDDKPAAAQLVVRTLAPKPPRPAESEKVRYRPADDTYVIPPLELLDEASPIDKESIEILCREKAYILEQTLNEFRLGVEVVAIETGPVITVFELKLAPGIKVSQITSLSNDLARALRAPAVRVVAPLPDKNTIGIEVPNTDKEKVRIRDLIQLSGGRSDRLAIPLYLGKDASGAPLVTDLTTMPHLLVAGTTGSGKSVCIASIVMSILMTRTPREVNLILVDPKVVELTVFKDVPHLMCPIVTEMSRAQGILDWAATKMDERYALLAEAGVKDIRSYNKLGVAGLRERLQLADDEELSRVPVHLPYIVIIIDELADLMMTSAKEVEFYLCRLAQKSRAVGIHLIVSTQRPQANVVTGLIKSNLPSRIAFRVSSRLDSRIVLDQNGAEVLMGQGDLLFLPPGSAKLVRAQGTFIADEELRRIVKHCREQGEPAFHPELVRMPGDGAGSGERDELFDAAVDIVIETQRGSVSLLQRRLTIGYGRASRLVDQMYEAGIVGEYKGSQAREVNITKEEWEAIKAQRNREEAEEQRGEPG
jgi:S-DNA-T family DNA segregation ATPase FtsK/SpoIIIE